MASVGPFASNERSVNHLVIRVHHHHPSLNDDRFTIVITVARLMLVFVAFHLFRLAAVCVELRLV
jgi:uncharacterized membrane protein